MSDFRHFFGAVILAIVSAAPVAADVIVVPNNFAAVEGNFNNAFPFGISAFSFPSQRYQQVFDASQFAALSGPEYITDIAFRPDSTFGQAFSTTLPNVQIDLSTTPLANLSPTYASNVGADDKVVFNGPLSLSSNNTGSGPRAFDIVIHLTTPFLYDPTLGNLLLDVHNFGAGSTTFFDAFFGNNGSPSRVFSNDVLATTGASDAGGLVAQFTTASSASTGSVAPEPSSLAMLGLASVAGMFHRLRKRKSVAPVLG